jgi:hypothetical protein
MSTASTEDLLATTDKTTQQSPSQHAGQKRPAPRGTAAYPRKRAITACQVCRARRTKCDNLKPSCSFCLKSGAQCIQSSIDLSSFDPASLRILDRLDELERLMLMSSGSSVTAETRPSPGVQHEIYEAAVVQHRRPGVVLPQSIDEILRWDELSGVVEELNFAATDSPGNVRPQRTSTCSDHWDTEISAQEASNYLDSFLDNVHVKNPILDDSETQQLVSQFSHTGYDLSGQSCLALLICALGAISNNFKTEEIVAPASQRYSAATSYFHAAQKRIGTLLSNGGLLAAQCLFFSGVFMATIFEKSAAWRYFNQALACCQEFSPLPSSLSSSSPHNNATELSPEEQAVYWSAWKSEREMRNLVQATDFPIPDHMMYPSFYPTPPPPPPTSKDGSGLDARMMQRQTAGWFFYLSEISMRRLSTRITKDLLSLQFGPSKTSIVALVRQVREWEAEIEQWIANLNEAMSLAGDPTDDDVCKWVLRGQVLNLYELIYWTFLNFVMHKQNGGGSGGTSGSIDTTDSPSVEETMQEFTNKALAIHDQRLCVNRPGMFHRHHGTVFMIGTCTRSALVLLCFASLQFSPGQGAAMGSISLAPAWTQRVRTAVEMIRFWQVECPDTTRWADVLEAGLRRWS